MEEQIQPTSRFNFRKIFSLSVLTLVFLTPIIFFPLVSISLYSAKIAFISTVVVVFIGTFLASTLSGGIIEFPKSKLLLALFLFPIIALLSSVFSGQIDKSIAGIAFDLGTSGSLVVLTILTFISIVAVKEQPTTGVKAIYALILSSMVVLLHLLVRAFAAGIFPDAWAARIPNFLVGGAIDTAIFLGVVVIAALSMLNAGSLSSKGKYLIYTVLVLSMIFVGAIGFMPVIFVLGLFALIYFVYALSWMISPQGERKVDGASLPTLFVLAISLVLILSGGSFSGFLSNTLKMNMIDVRPNFSVTMSLVGSAVKQNVIFGVGPNMFKGLWDMKRPVEINSTNFWSADFNFGSGFIPTLGITTGILGLLSFLAFLSMYLYIGFKAIFFSGSDSSFRYTSSTAFFASVFLWAMAFIYVPSLAVLALAFIFSGIFIGILSSEGILQNSRINVFSSPRANFASVFGIVVLLISSIAGGYFVWERVVATSIFQRGNVLGAVRLAPTDIYWRGLSESSIVQIGNIVSSVSSPEELGESQRVAILSSISDAVNFANNAIAWDRKNYQNWFVLGRVYEVLAANGIEGASDNARAAYSEALNRAPTNPAIPLAFARIAAISGNTAEARENIAKAIELKKNYTDAYFALAQLEAASNNIEGAIASVEAATFVDPQNASLYFQLGLLKYNNGDFRGAASSFEQAVTLISDYANARYFLGLSYEKMGRDSDAIKQFEEIQKTNPDNSEVQLILSNLRAGRSPFAEARPPVDDKPENRPELPIEED